MGWFDEKHWGSRIAGRGECKGYDKKAKVERESQSSNVSAEVEALNPELDAGGLHGRRHSRLSSS